MRNQHEHDFDLSGGNDEPPVAISRRGLVTAAAGGFAQAASGLFLPTATEEADAREGANDGDLGGRRGKNHRGRHRRRTHGKKKGKANGRPKALYRGIEWQVSSLFDPFDVQFWTVNRDWVHKETKQVTKISEALFRTSWTEGVLWINGRYFLSGENPALTPRVTVGHGGAMTKHYWTGGTFVLDRHEVKEDHNAPDVEMDGIRFQILRLSDSDDYKRFWLHII